MQPVAGIFARFADLERRWLELAGEHGPLEEIHHIIGRALRPLLGQQRRHLTKAHVVTIEGGDRFGHGLPSAPSVLCASRSCQAIHAFNSAEQLSLHTLNEGIGAAPCKGSDAKNRLGASAVRSGWSASYNKSGCGGTKPPIPN